MALRQKRLKHKYFIEKLSDEKRSGLSRDLSKTDSTRTAKQENFSVVDYIQVVLKIFLAKVFSCLKRTIVCSIK